MQSFKKSREVRSERELSGPDCKSKTSSEERGILSGFGTNSSQDGGGSTVISLCDSSEFAAEHISTSPLSRGISGTSTTVMVGLSTGESASGLHSGRVGEVCIVFGTLAVKRDSFLQETARDNP
jgi:hypothetical protein